MRIFNVWQIGAWHRNFGDWALAYQMHRLLNEQARTRGWYLNFYLVDGQRTFFYPELIDHMNEEADLIILGGGGHLFHRPEDRSRSGWMFNTSLDDLDRIKKPMVVYGIGDNRNPYDQVGFPEITKHHLRRVQERARLFSARNHGSRKVLIEEFGLNASKLNVIPDPGICLYDRPIEIPVKSRTGPVIALNWAGDRSQLRFREPHQESMRHFVTTIKGALLKCVRDLGAQIMFLPHLVNVDTDIYREFSEGFPQGTIFSTFEELPFLYPPPGEMMYPHVPFFTNLYRQANLSLGMRGHSCILAFGAGTKFMPIGEHKKVAFFSADVGVPAEYTIPWVEPGVSAAPIVFEKIRACLRDESYGDKLKVSLAEQMKILRAFNEQVLDILT